MIDISKRKKAEIAVREANKTLQLVKSEHKISRRAARTGGIKQTCRIRTYVEVRSLLNELNQPLTGLKTLLSSNQLLMERGETKMLKANMDLVMSLIDRMATA